jgi:RNA polymerase sigma-70 factor, ECF subfamily
MLAFGQPAHRPRGETPWYRPPDIIRRAVTDRAGGEGLDETGPPIDFEALVRRLCVGERRAGDELYRRMYPPVRFMLLYRTGRPDVADDLAQQTFLIALQNIVQGHPPREPAKLPGYMCGIARNVYRNWVKGERLHPAVPIPDDTPARGYVPYGEVHREQIAEAVRRLIGEMAVERDRDVIRRVYVLDQGKERICRELGLSEAHFDRVISRARLRFRELLRALGVNPDDYTPDPD